MPCVSLICLLVVLVPGTVWAVVALRRFVLDERQRTFLPPARAVAMPDEVLVLDEDAYPALNRYWGTRWIRIRHEGGAGWVSAKGQNLRGVGDGPRLMAFDGETEVHLIGPEGCVATFGDPRHALEGHRLLMQARDEALMGPWHALGLQGPYGDMDGRRGGRLVRVELDDEVVLTVEVSLPEGLRVARRSAFESPESCGNPVLDTLLGASRPVDLPEELVGELLEHLHARDGELTSDHLRVRHPVHAADLRATLDRMVSLAEALDRAFV